MREFNTKISIAQLLRLTIVSAKSKICSPRRDYLSPGNSIVLGIAATSLFISVTIFGANFNGPVYFRDLCSSITFQPTHANLLSSKITQHDKFTKAGNLTKTFSSENVLETNICYKRQKTLPISLRAPKQETQWCQITIRNRIKFQDQILS